LNFTARTGEIVGFAGLEGAGVDELFRVLFGLDPMTSGQIVVRDEPQRPTTPLAAMRRGWALIPESRREQGLMMDWSIARNTTLLVLEKLLSRLGLIDKRQVRDTTAQYIDRLGIATDSQDNKVTHLSGGNQQKVLLAKWLATGPAILILNDPTRGVDVGAKCEIYRLCRQLASQGITILMTSSEAEEILGLSDRVFVLSKGKVLHEFQRGEITKADLLHAMASQKS
jgi:ABC-type sugar transport system ATPase subunit